MFCALVIGFTTPARMGVGQIPLAQIRHPRHNVVRHASRYRVEPGPDRRQECSHMKVKLAIAFAAGFLAAVVLGFVVPATSPLCRTGYMTKGIGAERAKEVEDGRAPDLVPVGSR